MILIIGAGIAGITLARLFADKGKEVMLVDRRDFIGGLCYDYLDKGIFVQQYGPHIFHTNNDRVWKFVNNYAAFNDYTHTVIAMVNGREVNLPMCIKSIYDFYGLDNYEEATVRFNQSFIKPKKDSQYKSTYSFLIDRYGKDYTDSILKPYSEKVWDCVIDDLPTNIFERIPIRNNFDTRYFVDGFQGMPRNGFTDMMRDMLDSTKISILLGTSMDYQHALDMKPDLIINTGYLDSFFNYCYGKLKYIKLDFEVVDVPDLKFYQRSSVFNYPKGTFFRRTEFKHFYPERKAYNTHGTIYMKEFVGGKEICYPSPRLQDREDAQKYLDLAAEKKVYCCGRFGSYQYLNMDSVILKAMELVDTLTS